MALRLNPLSTSKGKKYLCELCGKVATFACQHCRVTYYCSREHQSVDWFGIHERICQLLGALRTLKSTLGSEDERQRRQLTVQMSQHALIDLCKNEAQKHLVQGQYELAIPGALQSLRFSIEVYGAGRIELVPAYLLLAESNLGLRRLRVAEEFLLYANWSVLKNPDCSNELKSQLCRNFGRLYACQERYTDALQQLAHDVYYSSLEHGPEHVDTAGGYFYMADVFLMMGQVENCFAFFDKVVDIWYKFLISLRHRPNESIGDYLSEAHIAEAGEMLRTILDTRKRRLGALHLATGEAAYALGILKHITGNDTEARHYYSMAHSVYATQVGPDREATREVLNALNSIGLGKGVSAAAAAAATAIAESKSSEKAPVPDATLINATAPSTIAGSHYTVGTGGAATGPAASSSSQTAQDRGGHHGLYADVAELTGTEGQSEVETEVRRPPMGRRGSSLLSNRGDNDGLVEAITEAEKQAFIRQQQQQQNAENSDNAALNAHEHDLSLPSQDTTGLEGGVNPLELALSQLPSDLTNVLDVAFQHVLSEQQAANGGQDIDGLVRHESLIAALDSASPALGDVLGQYPLYESCFVVEQLLRSPEESVTWPALVVLFAIEYLLKKIMASSGAISEQQIQEHDPNVDASLLVQACAQDVVLGTLLEQIGYSSETFLRSLVTAQGPLTVRTVFDYLNAAVSDQGVKAEGGEIFEQSKGTGSVGDGLEKDDSALAQLPEPDRVSELSAEQAADTGVPTYDI